MKKHFMLGSRGSTLALLQTQEVIDALQQANPDYKFEIMIISTQGDRQRWLPLSRIGGKGLFVKEIQLALLSGEVDMAVHSFKDLPTELTPGLEVAAYCKRLDPRDVLVSRQGLSLPYLPLGAVLGTSSPRRAAQIKARRPDIIFRDLRGNVETRLRKVSQGEVDGAVLAAAGVLRLGAEAQITQFLSPEDCLPAVGQGALAVETRAEDAVTKDLLKAVDHLLTRQALAAERSLLETLQGGCHIPLGALAQVDGKTLELHGVIASLDGSQVLRYHLSGRAEEGNAIGRQVAERLLEMGGRELVEAAWAARSS